jgi:hypothetical protein
VSGSSKLRFSVSVCNVSEWSLFVDRKKEEGEKRDAMRRDGLGASTFHSMALTLRPDALGVSP